MIKLDDYIKNNNPKDVIEYNISDTKHIKIGAYEYDTNLIESWVGYNNEILEIDIILYALEYFDSDKILYDMYNNEHYILVLCKYMDDINRISTRIVDYNCDEHTPDDYKQLYKYMIIFNICKPIILNDIKTYSGNSEDRRLVANKIIYDLLENDFINKLNHMIDNSIICKPIEDTSDKDDVLMDIIDNIFKLRLEYNPIQVLNHLLIINMHKLF